jgi:hypothetical protein
MSFSLIMISDSLILSFVASDIVLYNQYFSRNYIGVLFWKIQNLWSQAIKIGQFISKHTRMCDKSSINWTKCGGTLCKPCESRLNRGKIVFNRTWPYKTVLGTVQQSYVHDEHLWLKNSIHTIYFKISPWTKKLWHWQVWTSTYTITEQPFWQLCQAHTQRSHSPLTTRYNTSKRKRDTAPRNKHSLIFYLTFDLLCHWPSFCGRQLNSTWKTFVLSYI